jgi:membrane protein implicated in regulation of membrane protease activity
VILLGALALSQVAVFWLFKDVFKSYHAKTRAYTNAEGMIGAECVVTETIPLGGAGYVKLYGDHWVAKSTSGEILEKETRVVIVKIEGNKVYVERLV